MEKRTLIREGSRILMPNEYAVFRSALNPNGAYPIICDVLLNTGLRITEFWNLVDNPHWYHRSLRLIDLPKEGACKKLECGSTNRTIRLTPAGCAALDHLFAANIKYIDRSSFRQALLRAAIKSGIGTAGINPKMFRKMLASWLCAIRKQYGIDVLDITANFGHSEKTLRDNYLGIKFSPSAESDMAEFLRGWYECSWVHE